MKSLILVVNIFCLSCLWAQPFTTTKSELFKDSNRESYIAYAKDDGNGGVYIIRMFKAGTIAAPSGYYLEHYDSSLKLTRETEFAPEYYPHEKYKTLVGIVSANNEIHIIDIQYNIKEKAFIALAHTAGLTDFKFSTRQLFRLDRKEAEDLGTLSLANMFYESTSVLSDNSTVAFIKDNTDTAFAIALNLKSKNSKTFKLYSFDNKLTKKLEHTYTRDVKSKHYVFRNIEVADGGASIYLLGAAKAEDKNKYVYEIAHITAGGEQIAGFKNDKPYNEALKLLKVDDRLILAGFYSEDKAKWYSGISYFEIDPKTLKLNKIAHTPFEDQLIAEKNKFRWWEPKIYKPLIFKNIIVTENNDIIINAEEQYITEGNNQARFYHTDDIISARINSNGQPLWISNINRNCSTPTDQAYISYTSAYNGKTMSYYINTAEDVKRMSDGNIQFVDTGRHRSDFTVVTIDENGKMDYKKLLDNKENDVPFMTANGYASQNSVVFLGRKGGKKQLLKVALN